MTQRKISVTLLCLSLATQACNKISVPPTEDREDHYILLNSAINLGQSGLIISYLSDTVQAYWDAAKIRGADAYVRDWRRVTNDARFINYRRTIVKEISLNTRVHRDSGSVNIRIQNQEEGATTQDTTIGFVTYWAREGKPLAWHIIVDSLFTIRR